MRPVILFSAVLLAASASLAGAQKSSMKMPAGVAGTWEGKSLLGASDSVVTTWVLTATATNKGWVLKLPNREPMPTRVIAAGGDSVVTKTGPYDSVLRSGRKVTTFTTGHYNGDHMTGRFSATYANGIVVAGKASATRKK